MKLYLAAGAAIPLVLAVTLAAGPTPPSSALMQAPECEPVERMPLEGRASPYDSVSALIGDGVVKICYGRPSARGRTMIGGDDVPFGELWRTGANEPTILHTTIPIRVAGIPLQPGSYSIYTIPGAEEWEFFLNHSTEHWGLQITPEVRALEVGSVTLPRQRPESHVETFTIRMGEGSADGVPMILEWENFRILAPIEVTR